MSFAPVAQIRQSVILAFASYMGFTVYQIDVKSAFLYGTIEKEVYVHQPPGFVDPAHPNKVYKEEEVHEKPIDETKVLVQEETPTEIIEEHGSGEKGKMEISTANIQVSTTSPLKVSTVVPHVYTRRSVKDKGKAIMEEPATPKKVKKRTQVQLSIDEELARKLEEEERIRFNAEQEARALQEEEEERLNLEVAMELQRQLDQRQDVLIQPTQTQGID
ncbi:putative ribonuclease H-like domain-containing protein [Tanacetum coccineum]